MTHEELWLEIAEAFGTPRNEGTERQSKVAYDGICFALTSFELGVEYSSEFYFTFKPSEDCSPWWWEPNGDKEERCLFACFMAAMPEKDYNEMVNPNAKL